MLEQHIEQVITSERQAGKIRSKYGIKENKCLFKAVDALKAVLFLTQRSLIETFTDINPAL